MKLKNLILPILSALLVAGSVSAYTVVPGDTLSGIAKMFGTTYQQLAVDNGIENPNLIFPGQEINTDGVGYSLSSAPMRPSDIDIKIRQILVQGASRSGTTLNLDPIVDPSSGHRWTMAEIGDIAFGTLEPGTTNKEIISWTGMTDNTTYYTLTGVQWGYDATGLTTSTANYKRHNSGARFIITNDDQYLNSQYMNLGYAQTITGAKTFTVDPVSTNAAQTYATNGTYATQYYVNQIGAGGFTAANVSTTRGLSVDGSSPEKVGINASTTLGMAFDSSGKLYQKTSSTAGILINSNGLYIDYSRNNAWTGTNTFNGTTSFNGTTTLATTSVSSLTINGSTQLGFQTIQVVSTTGTSTWSVPTGVKKVRVRIVGGGASGTSIPGSTSGSSVGGGAGGYSEKIVDVSATSSISITVGAAAATSSFSSFLWASGGNAQNGGVGYNGAININGSDGGASTYGSGAGVALAGFGGNSVLSGSSIGVGKVYGGGGSGCTSGGSGCSGSAGASGVIIIEY